MTPYAIFWGGIAEGQRERYQFTWPGKAKAKLEARRPCDKTMKPHPEKSVNWDTTQNIYIDPPYNTGHDFIYDDDFAQTHEEYDSQSGEYDGEGGRLVANPDSNGRFHSDWCSMMYPRLLLARDLLSDDGVIFISIDDNEQVNLRRICDEIFGESSFVTVIHCQLSTTQGTKVKAAKEGNIVKNSEYILSYSKDGHKNVAVNPLFDLREKYDQHYSLYLKNDGTIGQLRELYGYRYPKDCHNTSPYSLAEAYKRSDEFAEIVRTHLAEIVCTDKIGNIPGLSELRQGQWKEVQHGGRSYLLTVDGNGAVRKLLRLKDSWGKTDDFYGEEGLRKIRGDWWSGFYIDMGNVSKEGSIEFKNGKKPVRLIRQLIKMVTDGSAIICDFFSGSATTAHAVIQQNLEGGGYRKFLLVQLPESCSNDASAQKNGFSTICDIGEERIRRAGKKIAEEVDVSNRQLKIGEDPKPVPDIGFRVFSIDSPNFLDTYSEPGEQTQASLFSLVDNLKEDRTPEDLLFQVLPTFRISYSARVEKMDVAGATCFNVNDGQLIACFDMPVSTDAIEKIAQMKPIYAVFRDASFAGDSDAANFEELFKTYSPDTVRRVI